MSFDREAHLEVSEGCAMFSWRFRADLITGRCEAVHRRRVDPAGAKWANREVAFVLDGEELDELRALAAARFAEGAHERREQFALAGVEIVVRSGGREVRARFDIEGQLHGVALYDRASRHLHGALEGA